MNRILQRILIALMVAAMGALAWMAWNPVVVDRGGRTLRLAVPPPPRPAGQRWQVVSRRFLREDDARAMARRLTGLGLHPRIRADREQVEWTGFADPYSYPSTAAAIEAQARWKQAGIDSTVLHDDLGYRLLLGRFYSGKEIAGQKARLAASGLEWREERHSEERTVWRILFPPQPREEAEVTWGAAQKVGGLDPLLRRVGPAGTGGGGDAR
ncbi:MAG: hypothetical protein D6682_08490 [Zetaproteobacteria bacterium]|nr:MAG: hypothetical protein D6682_08490 [Zetaproteobacteria bacterium]